MSNIVVAGAGTTGWLTALFIEKYFPRAKVTVVYDDKIPIIGVGESTTATFLEFTEQYLSIHTSELIEHCEATFKSGIKFTNWKGDGSHYHHTFTSCNIDYYCTALSKGIHIDEIDLGSQLCELNKFPKANDGVETKGNDYDNCFLALHFNAKLMAEYLQKVGKERGIKTIVGKIEDTLLDDKGYVTELILDTKERVEVDFVFDCTGFNKFFVNKLYKSPIEYFEHLPVKRAMPFFIDKIGPTPPYTESTAMKYGWMWKIPVGNRYGCGYVFDSDMITDEDAYKEICEVIGQKPEVRKKINFKAGYHTKPMNKNTLALGLAHGFLEPLESTSLLLTIEMLHTIIQTVPGKSLNCREWADGYQTDYNALASKMVSDCVNMISLHYLSPRDDTDFWKKVRNNTPKSLTKILNLINNYDVTKPNSLKTLKTFNHKSFIQCIAGVDMLDKDMIKRNARECLYSEVCELKSKNKYITERSIDHDDLLNRTTKNPDWIFSCK